MIFLKITVCALKKTLFIIKNDEINGHLSVFRFHFHDITYLTHFYKIHFNVDIKSFALNTQIFF